jgi:hypothetical protein
MATQGELTCWNTNFVFYLKSKYSVLATQW